LIAGGELPIIDGAPPQDDVIIISGGGDVPGEDYETVIDGQGITEDEPAAGDDDGERPNPIPGWIVIALLGMAAAFVGYMFLIHLPRKKAKEAYIDDEDDDMEEDYEQSPASMPGMPSPEDDALAVGEGDNPFDVSDEDED
jgi:hypothetical protein